jgi:hypothetical protein
VNRLEPNLLLAATTAIALALLIMTASLFGQPGSWMRYVIVAAVVVAAFLPLNALMRRKMGWDRPPMIYRGAPNTMLWAALFPMMVILGAAVPVFWPGHDYGLLVIIASLWFGATLESAIKAAKR